MSVGDTRIGTPICEDAWYEDVAETLAETGAEFLLVPNGSPYYRDKFDGAPEPHGGARGRDRAAADLPQHGGRAGRPGLRRRLLRAEPRRRAGGAAAGLRGRSWPMWISTRGDEGWRAGRGPIRAAPDEMEQDYRAMVLALRDYLRKTGFGKVLLGLSGGIDSALVAAIAVGCARGRERALRDAALGIHLARLAGRCEGGGRGAGLPATTRADRRGPRRR